MDPLLLAAGLLCLAFGVSNGFHDAGMQVGNAVATRTLRPRQALLMCAVFNFIGALLGQGLLLALTGHLLTVDTLGHDLLLILIPGLFAALVINTSTYFLAVPISATHCLFGGLLGAGFIYGAQPLNTDLVVDSLFRLAISPIAALFIAWLALTLLMPFLLNRSPKPVFRVFRQGTAVGTAALSVAHGSQDAQKIGAVFIAAWLSSRGDTSMNQLPGYVLWIIIVLSALAIAGGTLLSGWRVADTVSRRLSTLDPVGAGTSTMVAAVLSYLAAFVLRVPISMSFLVVGTNIGAGLASPHSRFAWRSRNRLRTLVFVISVWLMGMPASALLAAASAVVFKAIAA
ncbi:hypothetical protein CYJ40_04985 [Brevibacterium ravenspurgense]|uniref:Inorganic phosphate transporter n=1 Tax=Brevibacterium ravenspurgense TaxID=479117 RepID=A0A2I1IH69_9MICO|nr:inorganic phosphate transporter [Brevibacterium ravenspurgense]PKY70480.1 hypothetical protein CYJ40_04985 [Brevibacterium ravenspurgense]